MRATAGANRQRERERSSRHARLGLSAAALAILSLAAHSGASGSLPGLAGLVVALLAALALAHGISARPLRLASVAAWLAGSQVLLHLLLAVTGGHGAHGSLLPSGAMLAGHALAAGGAALVLVRAEALIAAWLGLARYLLGTRFMPVMVVPALVRAVPTSNPAADSLASLAHHVARRGPPRAVAALTS